MSINTGQCGVCGAKIPAKDFNPFQIPPVCDKVCARAHKMNRTRGQELEQEVIDAARAWEARNSLEVKFAKLALADLEDRYYNQPYLYLPA